MKKLTFTILLFVTLLTSGFAQVVNIPDAIFKAKLIANSNINTNNDTEIQVAEAIAFTGEIVVNSSNISSLVGLEEFVNITSLKCSANPLGVLDVSQNTKLIYLYTSFANLSTLDVSNNVELEKLICNDNNLIAVDVTNQPNLNELWVKGNSQMSGLDLTQNPQLMILHAERCSFTSLDVSQNVKLERLECFINGINNLDLSNNTKLVYLSCYANNIATLILPATNTLTTAICNQNSYTTLDVSNLPNLTELRCAITPNLLSIDLSNNNQLTKFACEQSGLTSLNLQNGNNSNLIEFTAHQNSNLPCIQVDDVNYMNQNWANSIDATTTYDTNCGGAACTVNIPDANFKSLLLADVAINTNSDNEISCAEAENYNGAIIAEVANINDLTGIEKFINIKGLNVNVNQLTQIDLSYNTELTWLNCNNNLLTSIDLTQLTNLVNFYCVGNRFVSLDLSNHINLVELNCSSNSITSIDFGTNNSLLYLIAQKNDLSSLDYSNMLDLTSIDLSKNNFSTIDLSTYPNLKQIIVNDNLLTEFSIKNGNNTAITWHNFQNNPGLTCIEVDDVTYANTNLVNKDATATYNTTCSTCTPTTSTVIDEICDGDSYIVPSGDETYTTSGNYADTLQNVAGCDSIITIELTVNVPVVNITQNGNFLETTQSFVDYQWFFDNSIINGATSASHLATSNGIYTLEITDVNGCSGISNSINFVSTSINFNEFEYSNVFPNPTNDYINIDVKGEQISEILIVSITGIVMESYNGSLRRISLGHLPKGLYFVTLRNENNRSVQKVFLK